MLARLGPDPVEARLENVLVSNGGQASQLGRYPIHMHMLGDGGAAVSVRSYVVKGSSNRGVAVHATNGALVEDSVAFDIAGHAFFLEDGTERNNVLRGRNLAHKVVPQLSMLASDVWPAGFWLQSASNTVEANAAADVLLDGYGYFLQPELGPFALPGPGAGPAGRHGLASPETGRTRPVDR